MLVGARLGDELEHVPRVEAALDELLGQPVEQLGVAGRVAGSDVVDGFDEAGPQQVGPEAVDVAAGEVGVVGRGDPLGHLLAAAGLGIDGVGQGVGEGRRHRGVGADVVELAARRIADHLDQRLRALDGAAAHLLAPVRRVFVARDAREVRGQLVVLVLSPFLERVVVALVAVEAHAEEQLGRVLHDRVGGAQHLVVARGRAGDVGSLGGQHVADELVVGLVLGDGLADVGAEGPRPRLAQELAVHLEQVGPFVGPMLDEVLAADEGIDELLALGPGRRRVGEEGLGLGGGRQGAGSGR